MKRTMLVFLLCTVLQIMTACSGPADNQNVQPTNAIATEVDASSELQIGGSSFTLAGEVFTMGESPDRLLRLLGEPKETFHYADSLYDGTDYYYHFEDVWVAAFCPTDSNESFLTDVYFLNNEYSFDGISVGSTAADLKRVVSVPEQAAEDEPIYPRFCYQDFLMGTEIGGWGYLLDKEVETPGNTYWAFLFNNEDDPKIPSDDAVILCIHIYYVNPL